MRYNCRKRKLGVKLDGLREVNGCKVGELYLRYDENVGAPRGGLGIDGTATYSS